MQLSTKAATKAEITSLPKLTKGIYPSQESSAMDFVQKW